MEQNTYKIINKNGVFKGNNLHKVLLDSKSEFCKRYMIYKNNKLFDIVKKIR